MDVVAAWASGSSFRELLKMTKVFEGSLVRAIRQLHEVLVQLSSACQAIGDVDMQAKFDETCNRVKRDIVFAASLYL
jgi:ATP-dependent RNA helicase DOB1